jgi:hypothetical protein
MDCEFPAEFVKYKVNEKKYLPATGAVNNEVPVAKLVPVLNAPVAVTVLNGTKEFALMVASLVAAIPAINPVWLGLVTLPVESITKLLLVVNADVELAYTMPPEVNEVSPVPPLAVAKVPLDMLLALRLVNDAPT